MLSLACFSGNNAVAGKTATANPLGTPVAIIAQTPAPNDVVATVADAEITSAAIDRLLAKRFPNLTAAANVAAAERLKYRRAAALSLVRRELALVRLLELGGPALRAKIDRQLGKELRALRKIDEDAGLNSHQRQEIAWRLAWNDYLNKHLTRENLTAYFNANAWKYDGTKVLTSQIFLPEGPGAMEELQGLKKLIETGELSFPEAAREHSKSPSGRVGGRVGWIQYSGDLPGPVSEAAFTGQLQKTLGPIRSSSGWHLVWAEEKRLGEKTFDEIEDLATVQRHAADYLFKRLVKSGLESAAVTWIDTTLKPPASESIEP